MQKNELNSKKVAELREIATAAGVSTEGLKKDQIIEALSKNAPSQAEDSGKASAPAKTNRSAQAKTPAKDARNAKEGQSSKEGQSAKANGPAREKNGAKTEPRGANEGQDGKFRKRERGNRFREDGDDRNGSREGREDSGDRKNQGNKRQGQGGKPEELIPVAGIIDLMESYAFLRTGGYLPTPSDVYVSQSTIRRFGLRHGDAITGKIKDVLSKQPQQPQPQSNSKFRAPKFNPLQEVDSINGLTIEEAAKRPRFSDLTPLYPQERLKMEFPLASEVSKSSRTTARIIDLVAPIGKGQRALIVAPPKAGKTIMMQNIANSISENNPEVHLMVVLVDERPEEVTDMQRSVRGEVISSTFDRPPLDHTTVAELAIERAKRLVEMGKDVVILLDSITRLARAYNFVAPVSGRILSGGVDASALYPPKKFLGAARNIEEGGSLTIIASALVETGSKMDEVIFEEFKGTGNQEIKLSRQLADKRIFPAVDVNASGTRREEWLFNENELRVIYSLHRALGGLDVNQAIELLIGKVKDTKSNVEFLLQIQKTMPQVSD